MICNNWHGIAGNAYERRIQKAVGHLAALSTPRLSLLAMAAPTTRAFISASRPPTAAKWPQDDARSQKQAAQCPVHTATLMKRVGWLQ